MECLFKPRYSCPMGCFDPHKTSKDNVHWSLNTWALALNGKFYYACVPRFSVVCTQLYKPLCWSVGPSISLSLITLLLLYDSVDHFQVILKYFYWIFWWFETSLRKSALLKLLFSAHITFFWHSRTYHINFKLNLFNSRTIEL